jgi:site-specific DNA recombinase
VTIHRLLTNEAYCGTSVWGLNKGHSELRSNEAPIRKENAWPAIIQPEVFQIVQRKLANRSPKISHPRTIPSKYLLSGIVFCTCGVAMMGHSAKSGQYHYYLCSRKYKQGYEACSSHPISKNVLEGAVINQIKERILTEENLEELVKMVNDDLRDSSGELQEKLNALQKEANEIDQKLSSLFDALEASNRLQGVPETSKLNLNDIAPRIKKHRNRQEELNKARIQLEADMVVQKVNEVDLGTIKTYAQELREVLGSASFIEQKAFLKSFIKRIIVDKDKVTIRYKLPGAGSGSIKEDESVLPIVSLGGAEGIRTPYLLTASQSFSQVNYGPIFRYNLPEIGP